MLADSHFNAEKKQCFNEKLCHLKVMFFSGSPFSDPPFGGRRVLSVQAPGRSCAAPPAKIVHEPLSDKKCRRVFPGMLADSRFHHLLLQALGMEFHELGF